jgi:hypothetical protein
MRGAYFIFESHSTNWNIVVNDVEPGPQSNPVTEYGWDSEPVKMKFLRLILI